MTSLLILFDEPHMNPFFLQDMARLNGNRRAPSDHHRLDLLGWDLKQRVQLRHHFCLADQSHLITWQQEIMPSWKDDLFRRHFLSKGGLSADETGKQVLRQL